MTQPKTAPSQRARDAAARFATIPGPDGDRLREALTDAFAKFEAETPVPLRGEVAERVKEAFKRIVEVGTRRSVNRIGDSYDFVSGYQDIEIVSEEAEIAAEALRAIEAALSSPSVGAGEDANKAVIDAMAQAIDVADRLIERGYGMDTPKEWNEAFKAVVKARAKSSSLSSGGA